MRHFAAILLFAFVAQSFASQELNDYLMEDDDDRHPYVQCKIDLYDCINKGGKKTECLKAYYTCMKQLVPTVPPFVVQCKDELKNCVSSAAGFVEKGKCFLTFAKCLKNGGPVSPPTVYMMDDGSNGVDPTRHPYVQCKIDLYDCIRNGQKPKLECGKDYANCMAVLLPTIPPFVAACKSELNTCLESTSTLTYIAACYRDFGKCLINRGPTSAPVFDAGEYVLNSIEDGPAPTRHPYLQCKIDMYKCFKEGKLGYIECMKQYRTCMAQMIPTLPPFFAVCNKQRKDCLVNASKIAEKLACYKAYAICLKNKGSTSAPVFDAPAPTRHPYLQCKIDMYKCFKEGKLGYFECMKQYRTCMAQMIPTLPPFFAVCNQQRKDCLVNASKIAEKLACYKAYAICLKNKGSTSAPVFDAPAPTRHPYLQCKIDLYKCFKEGQVGKVECLKQYKTCMAPLIPTIPPFVAQCRDEGNKCAASAPNWKAKLQCVVALLKCLKNKGPSTAPVLDEFVETMEDDPAPTQHPFIPFIQCKKDLYQCIKEGKDKRECLNAYKGCIKPLLPTVPPFVEQCRAEYRKCADGTKDWRKRLQCGVAFLKCIKNKGSS